MINHIMKNSALSTKVHAMMGKALTSKDYDAMMNMGSVAAVATYLSENPSYAAAFRGFITPNLHRGAIERRLREYLAGDIKRLMPFMDIKARRFAEISDMEEEISKIKVCLRLIHVDHSAQVYEYMSELRLGKVTISGETIAGISSIDEFTELLKPTIYYTPLSVFVGRPERQVLFKMEMALDTFWANIVYKYAKKYLSEDEAKSVLRVYGTEFDLQNLTFLLRCKRTFDMTSEEVYASIIPKYYRLREKTIAKIVGCGSFEEAIDIIEGETPYGKAFSKNDRFIENRQTEYLLSVQRHLYNANPYSIQSPLCYFHLRRMEIDNIVSIIEGIRYGLTADKTADYLVGYHRKEVER